MADFSHFSFSHIWRPAVESIHTRTPYNCNDSPGGW